MKGVDAAIAWLTTHQASAPPAEKLSSEALNTVGDMVLAKGQASDAVKQLKDLGAAAAAKP
ncbi:hypothetical protein NVS55_39825 [Myxococcus stipitatus]|uniref:hypothetical protein n=1 Tax=Myxococcus stipitatus TaxID=83455 RepID=UPI003144F956